MAILGLTLERLDQDGRRKTWTRASDATIAGQCGLCSRSVRRALSDLERGSWIERIYTDSRDERREIRLGHAVIEMWQGARAEAEIRAGQQLLPFDRPELPGPSKALPAREPRTPGVQVLRMAAGAEGLQKLPVRAVRTELSGLSGQICPPLPLITENDHRNPPPPDPTLEPTMCVVKPEEEEDGLGGDSKNGEDTPGDGHVARGYGPVAVDLAVEVSEQAGPGERCNSGQRYALEGLLPSERLAQAVRPEVGAWNVWVTGWDGIPPLDEGSERRQDLETLRNDYLRLGSDVLLEAIRHGRAEHARGRFRLFDLRRYCAGLRSTCVAAGLAAVKKRNVERLAAAAGDDRRGWDERVKARARELRSRDAGLAYSESIRRAEAELRAWRTVP